MSDDCHATQSLMMRLKSVMYAQSELKGLWLQQEDAIVQNGLTLAG